MNRVIAALHSVDVAAVGLSDYGKPGNYFQRQIGRWSKQYIASQLQSDPGDGPVDRLAAGALAGSRRSTNRSCRSCTATIGSTT